LDVSIVIRKILPAFGHDSADLIQVHLSIDDLAKQILESICAHGDEIRPWLGIIVVAQSDGTTVVLVWVVCHGGIPGHETWSSAEAMRAGYKPAPTIHDRC
jgi:hypothetical protein